MKYIGQITIHKELHRHDCIIKFKFEVTVLNTVIYWLICKNTNEIDTETIYFTNKPYRLRYHIENSL